MDKIDLYRQYIKQILTEHAQMGTDDDTVQPQLILILKMTIIN
jgi:hypothetical protein